MGPVLLLESLSVEGGGRVSVRVTVIQEECDTSAAGFEDERGQEPRNAGSC